MNRHGASERAKLAKYLELVGITPEAFETVVAVVVAETVTGKPVLAHEVLRVLGYSRLPLAELTRGLWLTAEGPQNGPKLLTARDRAWRMVGMQRAGRCA